jgi:flagellar hook-associated protein 2
VFGSGISFTGLGSGIDSAALIQRLVQLEGLRKTQLEGKKAGAQDKLDAFGKLQGLVKALREQADGLSKSSSFLKLAGTASREGAISFEVSSAAAQGVHTIEVQQLAAFDRWAFDAVTDPAADLASGAGQQVSFTVGAQGFTVAVDPASSSLQDIAAAIRAQAGDAVEASVVNVGTASAPSWRLVLASKESGEDGRIHGLTSTVAGLSIDGTEPAPGSGTPVSTNHLAVGINAKALVDGLLVERATNEFDGVLAGVTFTAQSAAPGNPVQLSVGPDSKAIVSALKSFVDAYNELVRYVNKQSTYSKDGGAGGALFGDATMSSVRSTVRSALFDVDPAAVMADTEGFSTLGLVGLAVQKDGTITVDETKLGAKISANVQKLADLFADDDGFDNGGAQPGTPGYNVDQTPDSGLAARLMRAIDGMLNRGVGPGGVALKSLFAAKEESLQSTIDDLDKRIADEEFRLGKFEEELKLRFASLENLMGGLNAQSAALTALTSKMS